MRNFYNAGGRSARLGHSAFVASLRWLLVLLLLPAFAQAQVPPGNALNFSQSGNNVVATGMDLPNFGGNFALEAWVRTTTALPSGIVVAVSSLENFYLGIDNYAADGHQGQALFNVGGTFISSQTRIDDGRWHHIAGTVTSNAATVYVDGVAEGSGNGYNPNYPGQGLNIGCYGPTGNSNVWPGSIDEVRVWSVARSATDIKASFNNVPTAPQTGLLVYYNFDQGTAGGTNTSVKTLPNLAGSDYTGTLRNFTLSGATSNWIESYALVVPTNLAATAAASGTSLTATWTAPLVGTVTNYVLDVSTTANFSAGVTTLTPAGGATSLVVSTTANTRYWLRLRADKTSVTGQSAYSRDVTNLRTPSGLAAPGTALAFDGIDDYVTLPNSTPVPTGNSAYTLEAWIKPNGMGIMGIIGWGNWGTGNQVNALRLSPTGIINYWWGPDLSVTTPDLSGHWHHVAATFDGTTRTIYLDGVAVGSDKPGGHTVPSPGNMRIGSTNNGEYFNGSIDEVRVWSVARTAADIKVAYTSQPVAPQAGLVAAYDFDAGTIAGNNTTQTTLFDRTSNFQDGTLTNFALTSGNTTSNYVESYARVVPPTAVSGVTATGFTAIWAAPLVGIVTGYVFEYSLSATFATGVTTLPLAASASSQAVSGLLPNRNYYYRLRADKTSVTGTGAYAAGVGRTASGLTPPGNALAFDGADDYVAVAARPALDNLATGSFTTEAWVYCTNVAAVNSIIRKGGDYSLVLLPGGLLYAEAWSAGMGLPTRPYAQATVAIPSNRWVHVASTYSGGTFRLYVDGVDAQATQGSSPITTAEGLQLGRSAVFDQPFNGRLDEVRIYNTALTQAQVQADLKSTNAAVPASLVAYYNFDQGTAGGNNGTVTMLTDQSSSVADGTLTNFALSSGNLTSNFVESYALVVPTLTAATGSTSTGFTANWTPPAVGTVDGYRLEVATTNTFAAASLVAGSPFTAAGTSQAVTGLDPAQTYYYRVRAEKASVSGQSAFSTLGIRRPATPMVPPGNALAFDGANDHVVLPTGFNTASFTFEAWVNYQDNGTWTRIFDFGSGTAYWMLLTPKSGYGGAAAGNIAFAITATGSGSESTITSNTPFPVGGWHHVAVTLAANGSLTSGTLYLDGVVIGTNASLPVSPASLGTLTNSWLGRSQFADPYLKGRLDEVRIYNTALTQAQVQADMTSTSAAVPASLVAYYNFDQGTAGGANQGYSTLNDQTANGTEGTLLNFGLNNGNTTSNWVESYALLVPTGLAVAALTSTGFTASWTAPTIDGAAPAAGIVEGYVLDVSTSATFASGVTSFPVSGYATTSTAVTGLANGTDYYLRVRAEKATVTGQGLYTPIISTHTLGTDAKLTNLVASAGQLTPAFATATLAYTLYVPAGTSTYTLTPTASNGYTAITVNGTVVASGTASATLNVGGTNTIVLTSEDGNNTATYTVQAVVAPGYFRSVATGNWADPATWETSNDGSTGWFAAPVAPTGSFTGTVTVRNGHVVTVASTTATKATTIESGGIMNTNSGSVLNISSSSKMTVAAGGVLSIGRLTGADGVTGTSANTGTLSVAGPNTLAVSGTLVLNTGTTTPASQGINTSTTTIGNGGRVVQYVTAINISMPVATWSVGSTLELAGGITNQTYATINQTLQNLDVNLTNLPVGTATLVAPYLFTTTANVTVAGTLTVRSTGAGTLRLFNNPTGTLTLGSVDGSGTRTGGYVQQAGTNVVGSYGGSSATGGTPITVQGSFQLNGGTFAAAQGSTTTSTLRAIPLTVIGDFVVASGATFNLLSGAVNTTINYTGGAVALNGNFRNAGTVNTGNTASTTQKLAFGKASTLGVQTFDNSGTISGRVSAQVNSNTILDLGTQAFTGTGTFITLSGSTLRLGSPDGISAIGTATGNVQSTGTRTLGGVVEFNGTTAQVTGTGFPATLPGTATLSFNGPAGVTLSQATSVSGTLSLKQGVVTTSATSLLTLGNGTGVPGTLDAATGNTGVIVGPFKRWIPAAPGARTFPVGTPTQLRPAIIDFTAAPTTAGSLTAEFIVQPSGTQGLPLTENGITISKASASGYWRVAAADGLAGGTYTPTFTFTGASGILDYTQLVLLKRDDPTADWALAGTHVTTTGSNAAPVLSRTGVSGFSDFTAGGDLLVNPLPVTLAAFTASAQGRAVQLQWRTASEKNSLAFDVERSGNGTGFAPIGTVAAAGSSSSTRSYGFLDVKLPADATLLYYRLKQVDADGTFTYSPVRVVGVQGTVAGLALFPNPAHAGTATLTGALPGTVVTVFDALGRQVLSAPADASGTAALTLPAGLPPGVYVVRAGSKALRLTVE